MCYTKSNEINDGIIVNADVSYKSCILGYRSIRNSFFVCCILVDNVY